MQAAEHCRDREVVVADHHRPDRDVGGPQRLEIETRIRDLREPVADLYGTPPREIRDMTVGMGSSD